MMGNSVLTKPKALEWLREQLAATDLVRKDPLAPKRFKTWRHETDAALERIFGPGTRYVTELRSIRWSSLVWGEGTESVNAQAFNRGLDRAGEILNSAIVEVESRWEEPETRSGQSAAQALSNASSFISPSRLAGLRNLNNNAFDVGRLIRLVEEIDLAFNSGSYHAVAALTRALIDHVPPIFNCHSFSEVANNYSGAKSFRDSARHLDASARAIGDSHLHVQIRKKEVLPTATQVNFSNDIDVLLGEVIRVLR